MAETLHIYPTQLKVDHAAARRLAAGGVLLGAPLISFREFESELERALCPGGAIDDITRELLLHEAVAADPAFRKHPELSLLTGTDGFIRSLGELVQQLKLGLVSPDGLDAITGYAPGKEEWIRTIFRRYRHLLDRRGLRDSADVTALLLQKLATAGGLPHPYDRYEAIEIHHVFHYAPSRFELVRLIQRLVPVTLRFPLPDDRRKVFDFVERDIQKFQSLEDEAGNIELAFDPPPAAETPLTRFAAALFDEKKPPPEGLERQVAVIRHAGRYREIEEVAEAILTMKGERQWSDFCLVFRDLERYGGIVEDVFRRARIPVYLRRGVPLTENPYIKTVLALFTAIEKDFERGEVARIAGSDYFTLLPPGIAPHEMDRLLSEAGVTDGGAGAWKEKLRHAKRKGLHGTAAALTGLVAALEKLGRAGRAGACIKEFEKLLAMLGPAPLALHRPFAVRDRHAQTRLAETLAGVKKAVARLEMEDAPFTWRDLRRILAAALGNAASPAWSNRNNVYVLGINELAGLSFPHVFICGLHDSEFPRRVLRGAILGEGEKQLFNQRHAETVLKDLPRHKRGRAVFSRLGESWEEESYLFYLGVRAATQSVAFCHSAADLSGKELLRSPFLDEIANTFPKLGERRTPAVALEKDFGAQLDGGAQRAKMLSLLFTQGAEAAGGMAGYYFRFVSERPFALACERSRMELARNAFYGEFDPARRAAASGPFTGRLSPRFGALRAHFGGHVKRTFSPTTLERYAKCPFLYFAGDVLDLKPSKPPQPGLEPNEMGNLVHAVLERYHDKGSFDLPAAPRLDPHAEREKRMRRAEDEVFAKEEEKGIRWEPAIWEIAREQVRQTMRLYLAREEQIYADAPFSVVATEFAFGGDGAPGVTLEGGDPIHLKGFADRIDYLHGPRLLRVIDYKHSARIGAYRKLLDEAAFFETSFQPPIYLFAVMKLVAPRLDPAPAGAFAAYLTLRREQELTARAASRFDDCNAGTLAAMERGAEFGEKLRGLVARMEQGEFSVTPADGKECGHCDFRRVCRYRAVRGPDAAEQGDD